MKKCIIVFCLFIVSCTSTPEYVFKTQIAFKPQNNTLVYINGASKDVLTTKLKPIVEEYLVQNHLKVTDNLKKAKYVANYGVISEAYQTTTAVPVFGKTGINSINTYSNGFLNGNSFGTYGYGMYDGSYTANYFGNTQTTVNYDYGVTGYSQVIENHFMRIFALILKDVKTDSVVYEASIIGNTFSEDNEFLNYIKQIYLQNPIMMDALIQYDCYTEQSAVCQAVQ